MKIPVPEKSEALPGPAPIDATVSRSGASTFSALKHRNFQLYFGGQLVSNIGTWMQTVAGNLLVDAGFLQHPPQVGLRRLRGYRLFSLSGCQSAGSTMTRGVSPPFARAGETPCLSRPPARTGFNKLSCG